MMKTQLLGNGVVINGVSRSLPPPYACVCVKAHSGDENSTKRTVFGMCAALTVAAAAFPAFAQRLPPLSTEPDRCEKAFVGNTIGQANGVADKLLDLRYCDFSDNKKDLKGKSLSAALMANGKFDRADMSEVIMSKAYAVEASFKGTDFTNAILDRVIFDNADMEGVIMKNSVLSGSTFRGANLDKASFEDALLGYVDLQKLCTNPTLSELSKSQLGCRT